MKAMTSCKELGTIISPGFCRFVLVLKMSELEELGIQQGRGIVPLFLCYD